MNLFRIKLCLLGIMAVISSCTVQKGTQGLASTNELSITSETGLSPSLAEKINMRPSEVDGADNVIVVKAQEITQPRAKPQNGKKKPDECDIIVFENTDEIEAKVLEITDTEIKYKRCDNLEGPVYTASKDKVVVIYYANGTEEVFTPEEEGDDEYTKGKSGAAMEGLGVAGFFAGLIGLLAFGLPLGILALVFGIISIVKINKDPERFKGRGFALLAAGLGILDIIGVFLFLAAM